MSNASNPTRPHAFNYQLQRLLIGVFGLILPTFLLLRSCSDLISISHAYHSLARDMLVAVLASTGALMLPYQGAKGEDRLEFWTAKVCGVCSIIVALFPASCPLLGERTFSCFRDDVCDFTNQPVHFGAATLLFLGLLILCWIFRKRAKNKTDKSKAKLRARIYELCMAGIIAGFALLGLDYAGIHLLGPSTFLWAEALMLASFSLAWLTASQLVFLWDGSRPILFPGSK